MRRREFIHGLMGRPGRLDLASWIVHVAGDDYFTQRDAVIGLGAIQGEVRSNLEAFVKLNLLHRTSEGRPQYRRVESPVWPALVQLGDAVSSLCAGIAEPKLERDLPRGLGNAPAGTTAVVIPARRKAE